MTLPATYVLPLALPPGEGDVSELAAYLAGLASLVDQVVVVDGSAPSDRRAHAAAFVPSIEVVAVRPELRTPMGKVGGVLTGLEQARHEAVVVADGDVRYDAPGLVAVLERLEGVDVVRPANYFDPLPWHARWDTARTLLNRVSGGDWPGTLTLRRSTVLGCHGYSGKVMFENLDLVRTVQAAGGIEVSAPDVLVRRCPPTTRQFLSQRVRQAYDELARPVRLLTGLAVLPLLGAALSRRRLDALAAGAGTVVALAEVGRRRDGGARMFPASSSLLAPLWVLERGVCSWLALVHRARGGIPYRGGRLRQAATPRRELRRRFAEGHPARQTSSSATTAAPGHQAIPQRLAIRRSRSAWPSGDPVAPGHQAIP